MSFDPDDLEELRHTFNAIVYDNEHGFVLEFAISRLIAKRLITQWYNANMGDGDALDQCFYEYSKIMQELHYALKESDELPNEED